MIKKRFFKTKQECEVAFELTSEGAGQVDSGPTTPSCRREQKSIFPDPMRR